uniref:Large ribosomal subunit protein uL2m n=1 Tax=Pallavicinia lyellii TaxID=56939 RepID=A0A4Y5WSI2_PALLY|nr:ribosomal protein L2 [Moerckia flotoviana]QDE10622.1 ribosomal protein L2 [Pallavicinia lyellii]WIA66581.1 ribosomal protein L2 [Moerckia flotoviana]
MRNSCWKGKALKQLTFHLKRSSAGRNSSGRITVFHRGGGSKRLQRKIDFKRSTSSMGIVERIEYDPNRSSWIALVRWIEGVLRPGKHPAFSRANSRREQNMFFFGLLFSFSSLPRRARRVKHERTRPGGQILESSWVLGTRDHLGAKEVAAALGPPSGSFFGSPSIAVAGAKPAFFAFRMKGPSPLTGRERLSALREGNTFSSQSEGQRWRTHSGAPRIKSLVLPWSRGPKAAGNGLTISAHGTGKKDRKEMAGRFPHTILGRGTRDPRERHVVLDDPSFYKPEHAPRALRAVGPSGSGRVLRTSEPFAYILASEKLEAGKTVMNFHWSKPSTPLSYHQPSQKANDPSGLRVETAPRDSRQAAWLHPRGNYASSENKYILDSYYQMVGNCIPLAKIPIGTWVHNIERNPGQGAKFTRAAGTFAQIIKKVENTPQCIVRLPSGVDKLIDSRCRATIGIVSNPNHGKHKLNKAGQSRWLGRRPIVRGVAMNPVDHPHGGGGGRTKGGRPSVSPWGKPTKGGFRTVVKKRRN